MLEVVHKAQPLDSAHADPWSHSAEGSERKE